ncbi:YjiH family protein [Pueribacillus sp. YX66]|uniref:YjiH family protein n=1 Tax=Pueribacillus sp. YX66 TaxID=3229242 RepID=UPI00358D224D
MEKMKNFHPTVSDYFKFILPSIVGIFLFIVPIKYNGSVTLPIAFLANWLSDVLAESLPVITVSIFVVIVLFTILTKVIKPALIMKNEFFKGLFDVRPIWIIARIFSMIFAVLTLFEWGPAFIWSENTGAIALYDLSAFLLVIFLFAGLFLPLLLDFGLLEFFGALMTKIMRPLFTLPGRSAIDSLASWIGDGTIGVLLTSKQYEQGYYTKREAAVIGTTFSLVSITFSIVILSYVDLEHLFLQYYLTIIVTGLACAIIMPRIPPLSRKPDTYYEPVGKQVDESIPEGISTVQWGLRLATMRARLNNGIATIFKNGVKNVLDMWISVIPIVMTIATLANILSEYTSIFTYLGAPFVPILSLLQIPEAAAAAQTMVIGFADMLLPAIIGNGVVESEFTKFIIASVSVTQLIYMSEVGALLLSSKLPVKFVDLVIIFFERTLISLPIIVLMAHILL